MKSIIRSIIVGGLVFLALEAWQFYTIGDRYTFCDGSEHEVYTGFIEQIPEQCEES